MLHMAYFYECSKTGKSLIPYQQFGNKDAARGEICRRHMARVASSKHDSLKGHARLDNRLKSCHFPEVL